VSEQVVRSWRLKPTLSGRHGWQCGGCGNLALVRRRVCGHCQAPELNRLVPLPRRAVVRACSEMGLELEELDHLRDRRAAVFLQVGERLLACLVSDADTDLLFKLRGAELRLVMRRRNAGCDEDSGPVVYTLKAATDLPTRLRLSEQSDPDTKDGR
jgi:uncharacterized OB-fold protein